MSGQNQNLIDELFSQIDELQNKLAGTQRSYRHQVITDLIRSGHVLGSPLLEETDRICSFIETGLKTEEPVKKIAAKPFSSVAKPAKTGAKKKRKYTKRSKFWKK